MQDEPATVEHNRRAAGTGAIIAGCKMTSNPWHYHANAPHPTTKCFDDRPRIKPQGSVNITLLFKKPTRRVKAYDDPIVRPLPIGRHIAIAIAIAHSDHGDARLSRP